MYIYKIIILCGLLLGSVGLKAQEAQCSIDRKLRADSTNRNRIITRATMYGVGFTNVFDTYLSPQEYKGIDFRISRESMRMTRLMDGNVSLQTFFQADLGYTHNKVDNNNTFSGLVTGTTVCIIIFNHGQFQTACRRSRRLQRWLCL